MIEFNTSGRKRQKIHLDTSVPMSKESRLYIADNNQVQTSVVPNSKSGNLTAVQWFPCAKEFWECVNCCWISVSVLIWKAPHSTVALLAQPLHVADLPIYVNQAGERYGIYP